MAEAPVLNATSRERSGKGAARSARRAGQVPGVIYGGGEAPQNINIEFNALLTRLRAGKFKSQLLNVKVDGKPNQVICRDVQRDVVRDLPIHVDFLRLSEKSRINLFIPVVFLNEGLSPGIKRGGVLTVVRQEVELNVSASDIPDHLEIDVRDADIGDVLHMSNIDLPEGVTPVIRGRDFVIANISAPSGLNVAEDEAAPAASAGDAPAATE
jgi:large subunit ribosomal protein L25